MSITTEQQKLHIEELDGSINTRYGLKYTRQGYEPTFCGVVIGKASDVPSGLLRCKRHQTGQVLSNYR